MINDHANLNRSFFIGLKKGIAVMKINASPRMETILRSYLNPSKNEEPLKGLLEML